MKCRVRQLLDIVIFDINESYSYVTDRRTLFVVTRWDGSHSEPTAVLLNACDVDCDASYQLLFEDHLVYPEFLRVGATIRVYNFINRRDHMFTCEVMR